MRRMSAHGGQGGPASLTARTPSTCAERALAELVIPPSFRSARLDSFLPDPRHPSQARALEQAAAFAARVGTPTPRTGLGRLRRRRPVHPGGGLYLDGGFGVGKTHLLAGVAQAAGVDSSRVAFGTFMQYTGLVGALGFAATRDALGERSLVCIDEFELDDPGDTVLMSTLLGELAAGGVWLAATSNTLPGALGEERFAAEDFAREIQGLADRFTVINIDGPDYRHREVVPHAPSRGSTALSDWAGRSGATVDDFAALVSHLSRVHPAAYGQLLDGVRAVAWREVTPLPDEVAALRLVVLVDRLYDRGIAVAASGLPLTGVFSDTMLAGGYRKKYGRARSRLAALARAGGVYESTGQAEMGWHRPGTG